jgi:RNA polymerase sigma-70 factor (ECF subfamily)
VRAAVANLENSERTALELAYFSDLSQSQIAERLEIPLGTVKTRIRSAMIKLREALSPRQK